MGFLTVGGKIITLLFLTLLAPDCRTCSPNTIKSGTGSYAPQRPAAPGLALPPASAVSSQPGDHLAPSATLRLEQKWGAGHKQLQWIVSVVAR